MICPCCGYSVPFACFGTMDETEKIVKRLAEETGHRFHLRMWLE